MHNRNSYSIKNALIQNRRNYRRENKIKLILKPGLLCINDFSIQMMLLFDILLDSNTKKTIIAFENYINISTLIVCIIFFTVSKLTMFHLNVNVILIFNEWSYRKYKMRLLVCLSFLVLFTSVQSVRYIFYKNINKLTMYTAQYGNVHN